MKELFKKALLSIILFISLSGVISPVISQAKEKQLAISKKNFPSEAIREYLKENYDKNENGKLSRKELKKATHIEIGFKYEMFAGNMTRDTTRDNANPGMVNIKGLHKLSNLQKVEILETDIKKIDELSKIKKLRFLEWDNYSIDNKKVQEIDLKKFPNFKKLKVLSLKNFDVKHIDEVKKMKKLQNFTWSYHKKTKKKRKIDLKGYSKLKSLKVLGIGQVQIKNVDEIKKMKKLQSLELVKNGLKGVDIRKNTKLVSLKIRDNLIKNCDISANRKLEKLVLENTQIDSFILKDWGGEGLYLYHNKKLRKIDIQNCNKLDCLDIYQNKNLQTADIKNTPEMKSLYFEVNGMAARLECDIMPKLKELNIYDGNFHDSFLSLFPAVEKLSIKWNALPKLDFSRTTKIKELYIYGCTGEQELDVSMLSELESLDVSKSEFTKLTLGSHPKLKYVECEQNKLTGTINFSETPKLVEFLCRQNQLTSLDMSKCKKLSVFNCSENNLKTVDVTGSWLYEFYCLANPGVQIRIVGTPDYYGWDKSAVIEWVSSRKK